MRLPNTRIPTNDAAADLSEFDTPGWREAANLQPYNCMFVGVPCVAGLVRLFVYV